MTTKTTEELLKNADFASRAGCTECDYGDQYAADVPALARERDALRAEQEPLLAELQESISHHSCAVDLLAFLARAVSRSEVEARAIAQAVLDDQQEGAGYYHVGDPNRRSSWAIRLWVQHLDTLMVREGGGRWNNFEASLGMGDREYVVTVQRKDGDTPAQQRTAALDKLAASDRSLAVLYRLLRGEAVPFEARVLAEAHAATVIAEQAEAEKREAGGRADG